MKAPPICTLSRLEQTKRFGTDPVAFLQDCAKELGPVFRTHVLGDAARVWIGDPDLAKAVFQLKNNEYKVTNTVPLNIGERSVLYAGGKQHLAQRKVLRPPFVGKRLRSYADSMLAHAERHLQGLEGEQVLAHVMDQITLAVLLDCIFGLRSDAEQLPLTEVTPKWMNAVMTPWAFMLSAVVGGVAIRRAFDRMAAASPYAKGRERGFFKPPRWWREISDPKARLDRILLEAIEQGKADGTGDRTDVLAMLIDSRFEDGSELDTELIHHQLLTLLVGGHETTSNTLLWTWHFLLERPDVVQALRDEQARVFPDGIDPHRVRELDLLGSVIAESMRLRSIAIAVGRELLVPVEAGGFHLPEGSHASPSPYLLHFNPVVWEQPNEFIADRFVGKGPQPAHRFMVWGGGKRMCMGLAFAEMEMRIILSVMLRDLDLQGLRTNTAPLMRGLTLVAADGVPVRVSARAKAPVQPVPA